MKFPHIHWYKEVEVHEPFMRNGELVNPVVKHCRCGQEKIVMRKNYDSADWNAINNPTLNDIIK